MPTLLTPALDAVLDGLPADTLRRATASLIESYRSGAPPAEQVLRDPGTAAAYAAYRMPATHAAVGRALRHATELAPDVSVRSLVDVGGGTGAATWAVAEAFPGLATATVLDGSADALALGRRIAAHGPPVVTRATWSRTLLRAGTVVPEADLAVVSYLLGELPDALQATVVDAAATAAAALLLVVEPGTPRGFAAVLAARSRLTAAGWHVLAPCPQDGPCPVAALGDWCHFSVRLDRTALHRRLKGGRLGHEDEKFSYVVASRAPVQPATGRVLRHPVTRKGLVQLQVCHADGSVRRAVVTKRDPMAYRAARDAAWGSTWSDRPPVIASTRTITSPKE
ncbi:small ribosomal subunit Rsm22 family protein [Fodinibacter luteus]|uniref:Small ribosomal subunit Rsm22 family protein n=1 Tax=Fodinibacter luteus TaxID=552064 RepID=A0ABP8K1Y2_9MICO